MSGWAGAQQATSHVLFLTRAQPLFAKSTKTRQLAGAINLFFCAPPEAWQKPAQSRGIQAGQNRGGHA